jgi:hypothetical protein
MFRCGFMPAMNMLNASHAECSALPGQHLQDPVRNFANDIALQGNGINFHT